MLTQTVSLHCDPSCPGPPDGGWDCRCGGVHDVEAFVQAAISARGGVPITGEERDELCQEGLRIMCKLANDYEPGRNGQDPSTSKFNGYASKFLRGKLSDAWHRLQGHRSAIGADGNRSWQYDPAPVSLEAYAESRPGGLDTVSALQHSEGWEPEALDGLPQLLADWWERRCELVTRYFEMRGEGYSTAEFAFAERLLPAQARVIEGFAKELLRDLQRAQLQAAA